MASVGLWGSPTPLSPDALACSQGLPTPGLAHPFLPASPPAKSIPPAHCQIPQAFTGEHKAQLNSTPVIKNPVLVEELLSPSASPPESRYFGLHESTRQACWAAECSRAPVCPSPPNSLRAAAVSYTPVTLN